MPTPAQQIQDSYNSFLAEVESYKNEVTGYSRLYSRIHLLVRIVLIILAAVVSAQKNLDKSPLEALVPWVPVLALVVAIMTALDTWLKPGQLWKTQNIYGTRFDGLLDEVRQADPNDRTALTSLEKKFRELQGQHKADTTP